MPSTKTPRIPRPKPTSDVQEVVVSAKRPDMLSRGLDMYDDFNKAHPGFKLGVDTAPIIGDSATLLDAAVLEDRGEHEKAVATALGALPTLKRFRKARAFINSSPIVKKTMRYLQGADAASDLADYSENTSTKYAKGGVVKSRDGIAKRGKTKGKMR